jgi:hypothetical protein
MEEKRPQAFEILGLVLMAVAGVVVAEAVGLLGAADSGAMKMGIGGGAAYYFAALFWTAMHR